MRYLVFLAHACVLYLGCLRLAVAEPVAWQALRPLVAAAPVIQTPYASNDVPQAGQPVVVTFFASWCPPCTDEFKHLNALVDSGQYPRVQIIGINLHEDFGGVKNPGRMQRFLSHTTPGFPLVKGSEEMKLAFGNIDRIPTVVVYGASGDEVWRFVHKRGATKTHVTADELKKALTQAASN